MQLRVIHMKRLDQGDNLHHFAMEFFSASYAKVTNDDLGKSAKYDFSKYRLVLDALERNPI